jgi:hypothetical protein
MKTQEDKELIEGWHKRRIENQMDEAFERTFHQVVRNQTLEEVAREFEKMNIGDTAASFAIFVRGLKR